MTILMCVNRKLRIMKPTAIQENNRNFKKNSFIPKNMFRPSPVPNKKYFNKFILIVTLRHNTGKSYKTKAKQKLQKQSKAKVTKKTQKQQIKFIFKIQPMNTLRFPLLLPIRNDHF